jgi:hypothetical protein
MRGIPGSAERVVLECWACGERTVLGGPEEVWLSGPTAFECGGCGRDLTLADRLDAELPEHGRAREGKVDKAGPATARRGWVAAGG